jgi:2Fe-2S ferredoxin
MSSVSFWLRQQSARTVSEAQPTEITSSMGETITALLRVIDRNGVEHEVEAKTENSMMMSLRELDYGVAAICGGMCACATCHVYVDSEWSNLLPDRQLDERQLLAELSHRTDQSRLSCQVTFTGTLAGLRVTIAPDE